MSTNLFDFLNSQNDPPTETASKPTSGDKAKTPSGIKHENFLSSGTYTISAQNWYTAKPYGFKAYFKNGGTAVMFLPINPSNLSITTNFATNVISTLYGTVEEHSEVRYYDITISGTTGMAPRFVTPDIVESKGNVDPGSTYKSTKTTGRSSFAVSPSSLSANGFFAKTLAIANQIKNKAADLLDGGPKAKMGMDDENSGYVAFHNLYRFLLKYKQDASGTSGKGGTRTQHPLTFFNYKDNNQYDVAIRGFSMTRSTENPMLYYYNIQLRGYNLKTSNRKAVYEDSRTQLEGLGLSGVTGSNALNDMKSIASQAKGILGSFVGGINVLGR